jgi:hypothetical protein
MWGQPATHQVHIIIPVWWCSQEGFLHQLVTTPWDLGCPHLLCPDLLWRPWGMSYATDMVSLMVIHFFSLCLIFLLWLVCQDTQPYISKFCFFFSLCVSVHAHLFHCWYKCFESMWEPLWGSVSFTV